MSIDTNVTPDLAKRTARRLKKKGFLHAPYYEEMPTFEKAGCEFVYPDANYTGIDKGGGKQRLNCQIVFGRDRSSHLLTGYGATAGQPCASIDIVAGRMSGAVKKRGVIETEIMPVKRNILVGNNFFLDASRIYISQKCDIDHYFGLPPGDFGRPQGEAGVGIKSDHVRVIGRDSVKIYAGGARAENLSGIGEVNSNGERLIDPRIEFLTAQDRDPEPLVLGDKLVEFLDELLRRLAMVEESFLLQNTSVMKMQTALALHFHSSAGAVTFPDPILAHASQSEVKKGLQRAADTITKALNFQIMKINYLGFMEPMEGKNRLKTRKNILSSTVFTN